MRSRAIVIAAGMFASGAAFGLPWDIDMADAVSVRAYERPMKGIVEGTVAQPSMVSPIGFAPNFDRASPEGMALLSPIPPTPAAVAHGAEMYGIYCAPCHGDGVNLGPVAAPGRFPGVVPLAGPAGAAKARTDGFLYLTIRNGGAVMPSYGWAMSHEEMWSVVQYVRTLPNATYVPPAPPAEEG